MVFAKPMTPLLIHASLTVAVRMVLLISAKTTKPSLTVVLLKTSERLLKVIKSVNGLMILAVNLNVVLTVTGKDVSMNVGISKLVVPYPLFPKIVQPKQEWSLCVSVMTDML